MARSVVMDAPVKLVIIQYYHGFNWPLNRGVSSLDESTSPAHLGGPIGRIIPVDRSFLPAGWAVLTQLEVVSDPLSRCPPGTRGVCWQGRRVLAVDDGETGAGWVDAGCEPEFPGFAGVVVDGVYVERNEVSYIHEGVIVDAGEASYLNLPGEV